MIYALMRCQRTLKYGTDAMVSNVGILRAQCIRTRYKESNVISRFHWERKKELLMSFGWSESEFLLAFRLQLFFMLTSEKKMKVLMEFFLTKLGLQPSDIVKCPNLFLVSLERRVIPRCSALKLLMSKGSIDKNVNFVSVLNMSKKDFGKRFITCFEQDSPELIKAYLG
ncbi:hypothetical protein RCOM_0530910 [Ricinus communis]|uniref:Uncharacterized protein n=1 Tax=Ricinus communis TaxID=3988 RepID=B9SLS1_RICCO|nr:hypothetical protein RCOM_0530910 [Ricinus communis]